MKWFKPSSKIFLLTASGRCVFCGSIVLFPSCFCCAFLRVCLLVPCGRLRGGVGGWSFGYRLWCLVVKLSPFRWCPGSDVVLDCIDS